MKTSLWGVGAWILFISLGLLWTGGQTSGAGEESKDGEREPGADARPAAQSPATYYVRPDGGSATQCTGLADAAYPGSGAAQPCAWDHPFRALPPGGTPRISGGDTLIVGAGSYGRIDTVDIQVVANAWHQSPPPGDTDRDGDGDVDVADIMLVAAGWGERCL